MSQSVRSAWSWRGITIDMGQWNWRISGKKTRNIIIEDLIELHHFEKEYSMIVKDRESKIKKYTEHSNQEKSLLKKRGQELYQILT